MTTPTNSALRGDWEFRDLQIDRIRRDGRTQSRLKLDQNIIRDYAELMRIGARFPPINVWFDGASYWVSDGFHRIAAAEECRRRTISAKVFRGDLSDAQWSSYASNAAHGLRRTKADIEAIIANALDHPSARRLSTNQIAKHIGVPEATLRRWRKRLSSSGDEDCRVAVRGLNAYTIHVERIGKTTPVTRRCSKSKNALKENLNEMRASASPNARRVLNIIGNWIFCGTTASDCLSALESILSWPKR